MDIQDNPKWRGRDLKNLNRAEVIEFCREGTSRQVSVLGYAQKYCPLAYAKYFKLRNPNRNISWNINEILSLDRRVIYNDDDLIELFLSLETQLINARDAQS